MTAARRTRLARGEVDQDKALEAELRALYAEADATFAGWSCPASADCCHPGRTGREPHVTSIELSLMEKARARLATPLRLPARRLPMAERSCAFLTAEQRCSIYESRPLGCRTF